MVIKEMKLCKKCNQIKKREEFPTEYGTYVKSQCRVCWNQFTRENYYKNLNSDKRKHYAAASKKYQDKKREEQKDILLAKKEERKKRSAEKRKIYKSLYEKNNKEKNKVRRRLWHKNNPGKHTEYGRKAWAKRKGVNHEPYTSKYIFNRDQWICGLCGKKINKNFKSPHPMSASVDHIVPLSKGGPDTPKNVQAAHWLCNSQKSMKNIGQLRLIG